MIDIIEGYKTSFHNIAYIFLILFLMQYFYNIVGLHHKLQIAAEKAEKQALENSKKEALAIIQAKEKKEKAQLEIVKEIQPIPKPIRKRSSFAAGTIIDFSGQETLTIS